MNLSYDAEQAKSKLRELYSASRAEDQADGHVMSLARFKPEDFDVVFFQQPDVYRVVRKNSNEWIEPNFSILGILCGKSLPPIQLPKTRTPKVIRALRQHVRLTGLGCLEFDTFPAAVNEVWNLFARNDSLRSSLQPIGFEPYEGHPTLDAHARYFTDRKASPMEKSQPFPPTVDPTGALESLRGEIFIHGIDNQVEYARKVHNGTGGIGLEAFDPAQFRAGDIVQVTVTFIAVPIQGARFKFMPLLRSLTLLDNTLSRGSGSAAGNAKAVPAVRPSLKRPLLLEKDEEALGRKISRIYIEDTMETA